MQAREADLLARDGRYALVGSTGSGKTTTLAKLASRGVDAHGAAQVALVAADAYRIGAAAQLAVYADLLGVSLHVAEDQARLARLLPQLADKKLVLIDTAGFAPTDPRTREAQALDALGVRRLAVISASQQGAAIEQAMTRFGEGAAACILTKLDETPQPGAALDSLIRHRLPLAYVSGGQRVPEDLHAPNAAYLIDRALKGGQLATPYALEAEDWPLFAGVEAERRSAAPKRAMPADQAAGLRRRSARQPLRCIHCFFDSARIHASGSPRRCIGAAGPRCWSTPAGGYLPIPRHAACSTGASSSRADSCTRCRMPYGDGWYAPGMQGRRTGVDGRSHRDTIACCLTPARTRRTGRRCRARPTPSSWKWTPRRPRCCRAMPC